MEIEVISPNLGKLRWKLSKDLERHMASLSRDAREKNIKVIQQEAEAHLLILTAAAQLEPDKFLEAFGEIGHYRHDLASVITDIVRK